MTPQPPQQQQNQIQSFGTEQVREQDKIQLILAYAPCLLCLIPLLTIKDSPFVQFHAKQGAVLTIGGSIVLTLISIVPVVGWIIGCLGGPAMLVVSIIGMIKATKGERWRIPVVADLADKINL